MCGIAGAIGAWPPAEAKDIASRMIASVAHRGPDGQHVEVIAPEADRCVVLAHARLTVLDPTAAAEQPMRHEGSGSCLIFNGEIYNYRELRAELEGHGHRFRSTGDTEVLLRALVHWGGEALPRLNGMYAFAFWDAPARRLLLARDPFGMKPLYVATAPGVMVFASELRALRASHAVDLQVSREAMHSVLTYGSVIEPATCFTAAAAIPPGQLVVATADAQLQRPVNVWSLEKLLSIGSEADGARPRAEAPGAGRDVERALGDAVSRHLLSDVPLAVLLSGGVDSALLAALANRGHDAPAPDLITVGFDVGDPSEVEAAQSVARHLRSRHRIVPITARALEDLIPRAIAAMDQPTIDGLNVFAVSSAAADAGTRVLLSGLGGDELFGGYTTFRRVPAVARFGGPMAALAPVAARIDSRRASQWRKLAHAGPIADRRAAYLVQRAVHAGPSHPAAPDVDGPPGDPQMPPETWLQLAACAGDEAAREVAYMELTFYMRNQLLRDADVFSSAVAVEMRVPFLDIDVVRAAWHQPTAEVARGDKRILRRMLQALVPDAPPRGQKQGFTFPWDRWLRGPLRATVQDTIRNQGALDALGVESKAADRMFDRFLRNDPDVSWRHVWSLFVVLRWQAEQV
jgi:asparagine synthase (glutamine-hydrolysing)